MTSPLDAIRARVEQAAGLAALLDAAYAALMMLLAVIEDQQDPASSWFTSFVMAGVPAAAARFALLDAPAFPASALAHMAACPEPMAAGQAAEDAARLSQALAIRLDGAAAAADRPADRDACARAARHARDLCSYLGRAAR